MKILLDTHVFIWALDNPVEIPSKALDLMRNPENDILISVGSMWEIAIKVSQNKLPLSIDYRIWIEKGLRDIGASILSIEIPHMELQSKLPWHHKDPFDRLLICQSISENLPIISNDTKFDLYPIKRIWG